MSNFRKTKEIIQEQMYLQQEELYLQQEQMYLQQEQLQLKVHDNINVIQNKRSISNDTIDIYVKFPKNEQDDYLWFSLRRSTRNIYQEDDKGQTLQYGKFYPIHTQIKEKKSCVYNHYVPNIPYMRLFGSCIGKNISNILNIKSKQGFKYIGSFTPQRSIGSTISSFIEGDKSVKLKQTSGILKGETYKNDIINGVKILCIFEGGCVVSKNNDKNGINIGDVIMNINNIQVDKLQDIDYILNHYNHKNWIYEIYRPSEHSIYKFHIDACYSNNDENSSDTIQTFDSEMKQFLKQVYQAYIILIENDNRAKPLLSDQKLCSFDNQCYGNKNKMCNFIEFGQEEDLS